MMYSNAPLALIITRTGQLQILKIKPILDKYFCCKFGWFRLRSERKLSIFKQAVYMYSVANWNPIDPQALKEIEAHCKKMKKTELERYIKEQFVEQEKRDVESIQNDPDHELQIGEFEDEPNQTSTVTEQIKKTRMVARSLREPINHHIESYLSEYCNMDPQSLRTAFKEVQSSEKTLKTMSKNISTYIPVALIVVLMMGGVMILMNIGTIADQIRGIFG